MNWLDDGFASIVVGFNNGLGETQLGPQQIERLITRNERWDF